MKFSVQDRDITTTHQMNGERAWSRKWSQWSNSFHARVCPSISKKPISPILWHISHILAFLLLAIFTRISARISD